MILHHTFVEDAVFTYEVCINLKYKAATAQAGLKLMTMFFEKSALLSGQYCNLHTST
jgi:hypothetical protein